VAVRYAVSPTVDLQLQRTVIWITDKDFYNIRTACSLKQNALWALSAGAARKICGQQDVNLLCKKK